MAAAAEARDLMANAAPLLETAQQIEALALGYFADPAAEPHPERLVADIYILLRIALDPMEGVTEQ